MRTADLELSMISSLGLTPSVPGKGGAYQSPSRDRLIYLTTCLVGHQVEVQVLDGSVFSGILHAANTEKDSGMLELEKLN